MEIADKKKVATLFRADSRRGFPHLLEHGITAFAPWNMSTVESVQWIEVRAGEYRAIHLTTEYINYVNQLIKGFVGWYGFA